MVRCSAVQRIVKVIGKYSASQVCSKGATYHECMPPEWMD